MCKKLVIAAVAILVGTAVVKHTTIGSLVQVWWHDAKQAVERQVPPEVQIKQLAVEVSKIDADIKRNLSKLAQQEVEVQATDDALAQGVFGVPTIGVGDKRFWGFDALEMVAALLKHDPWFDAPHWEREGAPRAGVRRS